MRDVSGRRILLFCTLAALLVAPAALPGQKPDEGAPADSASQNEGILDPLQEKEAERIDKAAKAEKPWNRGDGPKEESPRQTEPQTQSKED